LAKVGQLMALVDAAETQLASSRATAAIFLSAPPTTPPRPQELVLFDFLISFFPYFATAGAYTRASSNMSRSRSR
jgi:hypothetical protein